MIVVLSPTLDYTSRRVVRHASLFGPTAPLMTELLQSCQSRAMDQFTTTSQRCRLIAYSWFRRSLKTFLDRKLMSYRYSSCCSSSCSHWGNGLQGSVVSQLNGHRLTESEIFDLTSHFPDGGHDIISRKNVLPLGEWIQTVCPAPMEQRTPVPDL